MTFSYSRQIPPGGTGEITLKIKTDGEAGNKIIKKAIVYTNDPKNAIINLVLTGDVISPAIIAPKAARLIGLAGDTIQTDIKITPPANNKFDVTDVRAENGTHIRYELKKKKKSEAQFFILSVTNTKPDPGRYFDKITLTTTSTISPEIDIRVFGIIREKTEKH